jgi:hypothetical protein
MYQFPQPGLVAHQRDVRARDLLQQGLARRPRQGGAGDRLTLQDRPEQGSRFDGAPPWAVVQPVETDSQTLQPYNGLREALTSLRRQRPLSIGEDSTPGNSNAVTNQKKFHGSP